MTTPYERLSMYLVLALAVFSPGPAQTAALALVLLAVAGLLAWAAASKGWSAPIVFLFGLLFPILATLLVRALPDRRAVTDADELLEIQRRLGSGSVSREEYDKVKRRIVGSW
jgi:uncharacterized membrane protein